MLHDGIVGCRFDSHGLLREAKEEFASAGGFSAIESKGELVEVIVEVFVADRALVCPHEPALSNEMTRWTRGSSTEGDSFCRFRIVTS